MTNVLKKGTWPLKVPKKENDLEGYFDVVQERVEIGGLVCKDS